VLVTGQSAGTENCKPAKVTERHDDGTGGAVLAASTTERGEKVSVCRTR
jgi:hypothetical protein